MATFDAQAILDAVDAGAAPAIWRVYRAMREYFLAQGAKHWLIALAMLIAPTPLAVLTFLPQALPWLDLPHCFFGSFLGLASGIYSIILVQHGFTLLQQRHSSSKQMLVVTPDGFVVRTGPSQWFPAYNDAAHLPTVEWAGTRNGRIYSVSFARTVSVDLSIGNGLFQVQIRLIMTFINPIRLAIWLVDPRFGSSSTIAQSIIEAHARYTATHAETQ